MEFLCSSCSALYLNVAQKIADLQTDYSFCRPFVIPLKWLSGPKQNVDKSLSNYGLQHTNLPECEAAPLPASHIIIKSSVDVPLQKVQHQTMQLALLLEILFARSPIQVSDFATNRENPHKRYARDSHIYQRVITSNQAKPTFAAPPLLARGYAVLVLQGISHFT